MYGYFGAKARMQLMRGNLAVLLETERNGEYPVLEWICGLLGAYALISRAGNARDELGREVLVFF